MFSLLTKLLGFIPANVTKRLANRYTTHGSLLLGYAAVQAGVLPQGVLELVDGVPNIEIWIPIAIAFFLIVDKGLPAVSKAIGFAIKTKSEELEEMRIETLILEEKLKQQNIYKELKNYEDS